MKNNIVKFIPALPRGKQLAIQRIGVNIVNKFILVWDIVFWDEGDCHIVFTSETASDFTVFLNGWVYEKTKTLITFALGDFGKHSESLTDAEIREMIMRNLKIIYGEDIPQPKCMLRTKWFSDKNYFGSYPCCTIETKIEDFQNIASNIDNKVFFAGDHTIGYGRLPSTHSAYESGVRESNHIIRETSQELRPET